jgi:hypothetical protein
MASTSARGSARTNGAGAGRRMASLVTALAFATSACAVHSWEAQPARAPAEGLRAGDVVRAVRGTETLTLEVAGVSPPYVTGRVRAGTGWVCADLGRATRVDVRRPDQSVFVPEFADDVARDVVGRDVQLWTAEGPVALRVGESGEPRLVCGQLLSCRDGDREVPCTWLVAIDSRDHRIDVRSMDVDSTVLLSALFGVMVAAATFAFLVFQAMGNL